MTALWMGWQGNVTISCRGSITLQGPGHDEDTGSEEEGRWCAQTPTVSWTGAKPMAG